MTGKQPRLFQIWLDASDGSIASYDGVQWPDGTADVHHRYRRPDGVQWTPEALAEQIHGKQARIEWAPDHGHEQRERAEHAEAQVAQIRAFLEDMAGFGFPRDIYAQRGLEILDGVDCVAGPATQVSEPILRSEPCGYVRERWDGPHRLRDRCTDRPGHAREHGPWEMLP